MTFPAFGDSPDFSGGPGFGDSLLLSLINQTIPAGFTYYPAHSGPGSVWYVAGMPTLLFDFTPDANFSGSVVVESYSDALGTNLVGASFYYKSTGAITTIDSIACYGPYAKLVFDNNGSSSTCQVRLSQYQQAGMQGLATQGSGVAGRMLAIVPNQSVGASSSVTQAASLVTPGPATLACRGSGQVFEARITLTAGLNSGDIIAGVTTTATSPNWSVATITIPNDDFSLVLENFGASAAGGLATVISQR